MKHKTMKTLMRHNLTNTNLILKRGERVRWVSVLNRGWRTQKQITITLLGTGAYFEWFIFVVGHDEHAFPMDVCIIHKGVKTKSRILGRCVLFEKARVSFTASAVVQKQAKGADAYLAFRTLLLSPHAHARVIPSLEISTDDVSAGHAASIDRLADDALFYCASRGLKTSDAARLLTHAFLSADMSELCNSAAVASVTKILERICSTRQ